MLKPLYGPPLLIVLCAILAGSVTSAAEDPSLVLRYDFNQATATVVPDVSGRGHDGALTAGEFIPRGDGRALALNGSTTAVDLGGPPALRIKGDMTIEAWVKAEDKVHRDQLIFGDTAGLAIQRNYGLDIDRGFLWFEHGDGVGSTEVFSTDEPLLDGSWQHVAVVAEYPWFYIYVNGREVKTARMQFDITPTVGGPRFAGGWWAGHTKGALDDLALYSRALSVPEIRQHAGLTGDAEATQLTVNPRYLLGQQRIVVTVAARGALPPAMQGTVTLLNRQGKATVSQQVPGLAPTRPGSGRASFEVQFPAAAVKPGDYRLNVRLLGRGGQVVASATQPWTMSARPAWLGAHEKSWDTVPPPYTALKLAPRPGGGFAVESWGRRYDLGTAGLPSRLTTAEADLLAGPVQLVATTDGQPVTWQAGKAVLRGQSPLRATVVAPATGGGLALSATAQAEYDGFLRVDCSLQARARTRLDGLTLEIPLSPAHAQLFYCYPYQESVVPPQRPGTLDRDPQPVAAGQERVLFKSSFRPIVWIGDHERGLSWYCESARNWALQDAERALEIVRRGEQVILRVRFLDQPRTLGPGTPPLDYSFALQATPTKPMGPDCWDYRFSSALDYGKDYELLTSTYADKPQLDYLVDRGVKTVLIMNWTKTMCYPAPVGHETRLRELVKACHARGIKVVPYLGYQISELAPEWPLLGQEVVTLPLMRNPDLYPGETPQMVDTVCNRSVWQDRLVAGIGQLMDDYGVDGVYLDSTNMAFMCSNAAHGCGYRRADGSWAGAYPLYATRQLFQRIYATVKARKPDGIVDSHVYSCMNAAALAYSTSYWNGEQLQYAADGFIPAVLPLDMFRAMFMGRQWGTAPELLHYRLGRFAPSFAVSLLHDVLVRAHSSPENLQLASSIWKVTDDFGRKEAQFRPYWENQDQVTAGPDGVYASLYVHPRNGVLAVVSNLGKTDTRAEVGLNLARVGLSGRTLTARDALSGETVPLEGGKFAVPLPTMGWKLVWIR